MRRYSSVILSILIGALAAGISLGIFLKKSNDDRRRLEASALEAKKQFEQTQEETKKSMDEASLKLRAANEEVTKAQELIKLMEDERLQLASSVVLDEPSSAMTKGWQEALNTDLGISIRYPTGFSLDSNDGTALILSQGTPNPAEISATDRRSIAVYPYDFRLETELLATLQASNTVSYNLKGHLVTGTSGVAKNDTKNTLHVYAISFLGEKKFLVWMKEIPKQKIPALEILSTMKFKD